MDLRITVVLALAAAANAVPISSRLGSQCSTQCVESTKFKYSRGGTYRYDYDGSIQTTVFGASEGASGMRLKATADFEVIDSCDLALRLRDVRLEETDKTGRAWAMLGAESFRRALEEHPLRFAYQDGRIEDVCPEAGEKPWIANVKRGVLSSFQNSMDDFQKEDKISETDVAGNCRADYRIMSRQYTTIIVNKTKDLLACTDRHGFKTAMQATPYRVPSDIQSLPLTKSTHECVQTLSVTNGHLMKANCEEHHIFRPFSKGHNGAMTHAKHSLEFVGMRPGVRTTLGGNIRRSNMLFEHEKETPKTTRDTGSAASTLNSICEQTKMDVRPETPRLFSDLVYKIKELEPIALKQLHRHVISKRVCRSNHDAAKKFFHDAVPMAGTPASVSLISELVNQRHVRGTEADMWVSSLAFIQNPTKEMLESVKELLVAPNPSKTAYLAGSALVNSYCKMNADCLTSATVGQIHSLLERNLNYNCKVGSQSSKEQIIMSLKALGNMANAPAVADTLGRCFTEESNPIEIRLAAFEALKKQPCSADRRQALRIYADVTEDSEVRIGAYIAAMSCATEETINIVERTLESEVVNQVGSFVWTHLTNLMETSDPHKQRIRRILDNTTLRKTFDLDKRKYSRNFEGSMFFDSINTGAKVEGNLIWSTKSYIPRSAMFNLTVDLFGKSVNLMEFGGRAEGLEHMVEKYFGPNGYFSDSNVKDVLKKRGKRSVSDDKMNLIDNQFTSETKEEPKGSLYFKIFGQEIKYLDFEKLTAPGGDLNILDILIKLASNHDINFSKSVMFLDTTMTIPTVLGLPLKLSINGTATLNMQITGKMDVRRLHPSPRTMDINGAFKPSAAVEISSMMSVDANVARTGLKMVTTIHSSTAIEGKMQIQDSQVVNVKFEMPRDKIEIISAENKFYIVHQSQEIEQTMIDSNRVNTKKCTGDKLTKVLGIELCGEISYPTTPDMSDVPTFPMTGPAKMSVVLNKLDSHTSYDFEAILKTTKVRTNGQTALSHAARLGFNTPGSKTDREFLFDFLLNRGSKALNFELKTPWKKANLNGALVQQDDLKRATLRLMIDETKEYSVMAEIQMDTERDSQGAEKKTLTPNIEIRIPDRQPVLISGSVTSSTATNKYLEYSLNVQQLFTTPVTINGAIRKEVRGPDRDRYNTNFDLQSPILKTSLSGFLDCRADNYKSRMSVSYQWQKRREETVNLNFKGRNSVTRTMRKMLFDTAVSLSAYPNYNTHVKWDAETTDTHFETSVDVKYGPDPNDRTKRLSASTIINYEKHGPKFNADARLKFYFPAKDVNVDISGKHHHDSRRLETKAEVEYKPGKRINAQINLMNLGGRLMKYSGAASLVYPGREMAVSSKIEQTRDQEYHTSSRIQWQRSKEIREQSTFKYDAGVYSVNSEINIPDKDPITVEGSISPKLDDFGARLKVNAMNEVYSGDVAYTYVKQGKQFTGSASADVFYPGRRITGTSDMKLFVNGEHGFKMDVKWDADNDDTKSLVVDGLYKMQSYSYVRKHEATATVIYPGRKVLIEATAEKAAGEYKSHAMVDWEDDRMQLDLSMINTKIRASRAISGSIKFTSPFQYVEDVGAGFMYNSNGQTYKTGADVTWAPAKTISANALLTMASLKDMEGNIAVVTPFNGLKKMGIKGKYLYQDKELSFILGGEADDKKIEAELTGKYKDTIEGALKVDVPFLSRRFGASFTHKGEDSTYVTTAEVMWDRVNKILANLDLDITSLRSFGGTFQMQTPFSPVTRIGAVLTHGIVDGEMATKLSGNVEDKQMAIEVKGKNNNSPTRRNMEGSIRITTPFQNYDDMSLSLKHTDDGRIFSSSMSAAWQRTKRVTASFDMKHERQGWMLNNNGKIQITTPYRQFRRVGYEWKHQNSESTLESEHTVTINAAQWGIVLGGNLRLVDGFRVYATVALKTPIEEIRNINSALEFEINRQKIVSAIELSHLGRRASAGFTLTGNSWRAMEGTAHLDLTALLANVPGYLEPIAIVLKTEASEMPYSGYVNVNRGDDIWRLEITTTPQGWDSIALKATLTTPLPAYESVVLDVTHVLSRESSDSAITLTYQPQKAVTVQVKSNFDGTDKIKGDLVLSTPFDVIRSFKVEFDHDKDYRGFTDKGGFELQSQVGKIAFTTGLTYYGKTYISGNAKVTTPYENFESFGLGFTHQGQPSKMETTAYVDYAPSKKVEATASVEYSPVRVTIGLTSPCETLSSLSLNIQHDGEMPATETRVTILSLVHGKEIQFTGTATMESYSLVNGNMRLVTPYEDAREFTARFTSEIQGVESWKAKVDITTPIADHERYLLNLEYNNKEQKQHEVSAILEYPAGKNEMSFAFQKHATNQPLILKFMLKTPSYYLTSLSLDLKHSGTLSKFEHDLIFDYDAYISRVHIENKWFVDGINHIVGDARMASPIKHFEYTGFSINHQKDDLEWATSGTLEYSPGKRIKIKNEIKFEDKFELDFEVTTPFRYGRLAAIKIEHEGGLSPVKNDITLEFDSTKLTSEWEMDSSKTISGDMKFTSRISGWERITLKANHVTETREAVSELKIKLPSSEEIKVDVTTKFGNQQGIKIVVHTPFSALSNAKLEYSQILANPTLNLNLQMTNWENAMNLEGNFRMPELGAFAGNLDFSSPYEGYEKLSVTFSNEIARSKYTSELSIELSRNKKIELTSEVDLRAWTVDVKLTTPFESCQSASLKFDHRPNIQSPKEPLSNLVEIQHLSAAGLTKFRSSLKFTVSTTFGVEGEVKLTSPYDNFKLIALEYTSESTGSDSRERKGKLVLNYEGKKIEYTADTTLSNLRILTSNSLKTPWEQARDVQWNYEVTDMQAAMLLSKRGGEVFKDFYVKFDMTHNMWRKKMMYELQWKIRETLWEVMARSSSQWYDDFSISFTHTPKGLRSCETVLNAALGVNKVEYESELQLSSLENFKGTIQINFQFPGMTYRTNKIEFEHTGNLENFKSSVLYDTNSFGLLSAEIDWDFPSRTGVLKGNTPWTGPVVINFNHQGIMTDFSTSLRLDAGPRSASFSTVFKLSPRLTLDVKFKSPFDQVRELSLFYTHEGDLKKFECNTEMIYNKEKTITGKLQFQQSPTIIVRVDVTTPFEDFRQNHIEFTHAGELKSGITTILDAQIMVPITARADFQMNTNFIKFTGTSTTPFLANTESVKLTFIHSGEMNNFETDLQMSAKIKGREKKIVANVNFQNSDTISLRARLNTPFKYAEDTYFEIEHLSEGNEYKTTGKVTFNRGQTINAKVNLQTAPDITFKAEVETPFEGFETNIAEVGFSGSVRRFNANLKIKSYRQQEGGFTLDYMNYNFRRLQSTLTVFLPFANFESQTVKVTHTMSSDSFNTKVTYEDARNRKVDASVDFSSKPVALTVKISSPIVVLNVVHGGDYTNFQTNGDLDVYDMTFKTNAMFNMVSYTGALNVYTPWANVMINHNGDLSKFKSNLTATYSGKKIETIAAFDMGPTMALFLYKSPYVSVTISHNGPITAFRSSAEVYTHGGDHIKAEVMFNKNNKISGSAKFTSRYKYVEDLEVSFDHFGSTRQFRTVGAVQWATGKTIDGEVEFRRSRRNVVGNVNINTPFAGFEKLGLNVNHHGPKTQLRTTVSVLYMTQKRIQAIATYEHLKRGTFTFSSPIKYINSIAATFNSARVNNKDGYHAEFSWAPQQTIVVDVTGAFDGVLTSASVNGYMKMRTPFDQVKELIIEMEHSHSKSYLGNTLQIDYNMKPFIITNIVARRGDDKIGAEATMSAPWPLKTKFSLDSGNNAKVADFEVNWDTTKHDKKASLNLSYKKEDGYYRSEYRHSIRLSVPRRVLFLTSNIDKTKTQFAHTVTASMNGKEITYTSRINNLSRPANTDLNGVIMLATPFRTLKSAFKYQCTPGQINVEYDWFWNFAASPDAKVGLRLKVDDYMQTYGANFEVTILPPRMPKGITLRNNVVRRRGVIDTKTEFEYSEVVSDKITLNTRLAVATTGPHNNFTGMVQLTQPTTLTDIKLDGHIGTSYSKASAGAQMQYLTADQQLKNFLLMTEIDHVKDTLFFQVQTPMKTVHMTGKKISIEKGFLLTHNSVHDGEDSVSSSLKLNLSVPSFDYTVNYDADNMDNVFKMYGKYLSNKEVVFETFRQHNARHISEIYLSARLNSTRVLHSRIHWRPAMWSDIKKSTLALFEDSHPLMQAWQEVKDAVNKEVKLKAALLEEAMPDLQPANDYLMGEVESLKEDALELVAELNKMYAANDFYMKDIADVTDKVLKYMEEKTTHLGYQMRQKIAVLRRVIRINTAYLRRVITDFNGKIEENIAALVLKFRPAWQSYAYAVIRGYEETSQTINHGWEDWLESVDQTWADFVKTMDEKFDFISFKFEAYMDKFRTFQETLRAKLMSSKPKRWLDQIRDRVVAKFNEWKAKWDTKISALKAKVTVTYTKVANAVNDRIEKIIGHEYTQIVIRWTKATQQKMVAKWNNWEVRIKLAKWIKTTSAQLKVYAKVQFKKMIDNYMRLENTGFTVFDPRNGEIQFELWLPLELNTLREFPDISLETLKVEWTKLKNKYWPESDYSFWDTYYKFKPNTDYFDWIPPFKASAMLTHGRHYTTFDGEHFDFAGTCSYLLTKDFTDGNFSVIVNYDNGKKTSVIVNSNKKEFEIFPDFKVSVDNVRTELPYQYMNTTVVRNGYSIRVHNDNGFTMTCDMANDICTFNVTGWYFGKMAGLLGTYNNEQYDDKLTADRRIEDNVEQFARSWEVGSYCHVSRNIARQVTTTKGSESDKLCRKYFEYSKSVFRPCFKQVDPAPHLVNCISDIEQDSTSRTIEEKGCGTFTGYVAECRRLGVPIRVPQTCVTCSGANVDTFKEGESRRIVSSKTPNAQSADVVFVVEEKRCNVDAATKLADMGVQIDNALKAQGLQNNRFAVVGFGGQGVHNFDQTHTTEGKLFNDARKLHLAINSLDFQQDGPNMDMLRAVKFATNYPFRTGVSKNVIILPCSECQAQAVGYAEMQQMLAEKDITLHMLMAHDFALRTSSPVKTSYIFGLDEKAVFTNKDVNAPILSGDAVLKNQVIMPKDICVTLALETNGTVFNIQKLLAGRYTTQKAFLDVFARRLANSAHPTKCQICECTPDINGVGRSVCTSCETPSYNLFFKFLPKQLQNKAVQYNYGPKNGSTSLNSDSPTDTDFDMDFDEYITQGQGSSFETLRSH
ncbi:apolipophorins-like [Lineus longissimus]|uniref:apolipophorins-like n=1 Tax=Lineus longissimus TaxID=88925 RepID=UPI002B4DA16F